MNSKDSDHPPLWFYLLCEIALPENRSLDEVVANAVCNILTDHVGRLLQNSSSRGGQVNVTTTARKELACIHFVLYSWSHQNITTVNLSIENVKKHITVVMQEGRKEAKEKQQNDAELVARAERRGRKRLLNTLPSKALLLHYFNEKFVLEYLDNYPNNIHIVPKDVIEDWLLPSLLPIPLIVEQQPQF
jgi:hypothetical protein